MTVWVVCGGDFPDSVWDCYEAAEKHVEKSKKREPRVRFRIYEYQVQS